MKDKNSMFKLNTMGDDVYEEMKKDILNLRMKPGTPVTEQGICEKYGISRTPSRHVLQRLRDDGLIHSIPYKASFVSLLDFKKIEQIIFMRCAIEEKVMKEAMKKKNDKFLKELKRSLRNQEDLLSEEFTPEEFYAMDAEFHAIWFRFRVKSSSGKKSRRCWCTIKDSACWISWWCRISKQSMRNMWNLFRSWKRELKTW